MMTTKEGTGSISRQARKDAAKKQKRKRIEESGGVRPRKAVEERMKPPAAVDTPKTTAPTPSPHKKPPNDTRKRPDKKSPKDGRKGFDNSSPNDPRKRAVDNKNPSHSRVKPLAAPSQQHRFGRVMQQVPCPNKPRYSTFSMAIPGSILSNCQTHELRTHLVGQIARSATIYHVDEIIVYDDQLSTPIKDSGYNPYRRRRTDPSEETNTDEPEKPNTLKKSTDPHVFMARILQYCECPQYLRRNFFPMHPDLQYAGLLNPLDAPHHVREGDASPYREGVVLKPFAKEKRCVVNCGIKNRPVEIDKVLEANTRCTVKLDPKVYKSPGKRMKGEVVSPAAPREDEGMYWGYTVRMAKSITDIFEDCPFEEGYDLKIGTSERGDTDIDKKGFQLNNLKFRHCVVVFGGVAGIEESVDADEALKVSGEDSRKLFDMWINTCPLQGSRTIRTEEAVLITLARLRPFIKDNVEEPPSKNKILPDVEFSDEAPSSEESEGEDESS